MPRFMLLALLLLLCAAAFAASIVGDEEFVGPFPSWLNVKKDFGAVGDGKADDTVALQKGLDALRTPERKHRVLFIPAGTYRITKTISLLREPTDATDGLNIVGEDPGTTIIKWDGAPGENMFYFCAWYSKLGRLTFDGAGKAKTAIFHGKPFVTANEIADLVIKDVDFGMEAGERDGIAETAVLRCTFLRCAKAGINIQNFNTLDWWIWYSTFEDCHIGVSSEYNNGGGHFHVYNSIFRRSREADITIMHASYFGIRNNTSIDSKAFFVAKRAGNWADKENWGAQATLQGNVIIDPQDDTPIRLASAGATQLLDNVIKCRPGEKTGPLVYQHTPSGEGDMVAIGNTFSVKNPFDVQGRLIEFDNKNLALNTLKVKDPDPLPETPPNLHRPIIEVQVGAKAADIQQAIDKAAMLSGKRPVVHLPGGTYQIDHTLVIPANSDLQLIGDGTLYTTQLSWAGQGTGPVLRLLGPSRALLRDFNVLGSNTADGIVVENCDQPGARIYMNQVQVASEKEVGLLIDGLEHADVSMDVFSHSGCKVAVRVIGGPLADAGKPTDGRNVIFCGASSANNSSYDIQHGGKLLVRDIWYETSAETQPTFLHLSGKGSFTLHGAEAAAPATETAPNIVLDNFQGKVTLLGMDVTWWKKNLKGVRVQGDGAETKLLLMGNMLQEKNSFLNDSAHAQVAFLLNRAMAADLGTAPEPDQGKVDPAFIRQMLDDTRNQRPRLLTPLKRGVTDLRLYRVYSFNAVNGIQLQAK